MEPVRPAETSLPSTKSQDGGKLRWAAGMRKLTAFLLILLVAETTFLVFAHGHGVPGDRPGILGSLAPADVLSRLSGPGGDDQSLIAQIDRDAASLTGPPRTTPASSPTKLSTTRAAILRGDFQQAGEIFQEVANSSTMGPWSYAPVGAFFVAIPMVNDEPFRQRLDEWVAAEPRNTMLLVLRALYYRETAWARRGDGYWSGLNSVQKAGFHSNVAHGTDDIEAALRLGNTSPVAQYARLELASDSGGAQRLEAAFQDAIRQFPGYFPLYRQRLLMLRPQWGGSVEKMAAFVRFYANGDRTSHRHCACCTSCSMSNCWRSPRRPAGTRAASGKTSSNAPPPA